MPVVWLVLTLVLQLMAAACHSDGSAPSTSPLKLPGSAGQLAPVPANSQDSDHDGLCDSTEEQLGSDPHQLDSDSDGLPDVVEVVSGFDPTDASSPGIDQVGYLAMQAGSTLDFDVRATFDGVGQGASGSFIALNALIPQDWHADQFLENSTAVSAVPPDNVRDIDADQQHFGSVLGNTRLTFSLHFAYGNDPPLACSAGLPFGYQIKSDSGGFTGARGYLLVVSPDGSKPEPAKFCRPTACL
jgi:hypothetical protein